MKLNRLKIYRPEYECLTDKPIYARIIVMSNFYKLVCINKVQPCINYIPAYKPYWLLAFPKIHYKKVSPEEMKSIKSR